MLCLWVEVVDVDFGHERAPMPHSFCIMKCQCWFLGCLGVVYQCVGLIGPVVESAGIFLC